jgi:hypothetical protein
MTRARLPSIASVSASEGSSRTSSGSSENNIGAHFHPITNEESRRPLHEEEEESSVRSVVFSDASSDVSFSIAPNAKNIPRKSNLRNRFNSVDTDDSLYNEIIYELDNVSSSSDDSDSND